MIPNWLNSITRIMVIPTALAGGGSWLYNLGYCHSKDAHELAIAQLDKEIDNLEKKWEDGEKAQKVVDALETLEKFRDAADRTFRLEAHYSENEQLKNRVRNLHAKIDELETTNHKKDIEIETKNAELTKAKQEAKVLQNELNEKFSLNEKFKINTNSSKILFDGLQSVGIQNYFGNFLKVKFPGGTVEMYASDTVSWESTSSNCTLTLIEIFESDFKTDTPSAGEFHLLCK